MIIRLLQKLRAATTKDNRPTDTSAAAWLRTILVTSVGVTALVVGVRELKWLQTWELNAYDQMLRLRPPEAPDKRILLVMTENDISNQTLNQLLQKLESYQPRIIGISLFRSNQKDFAAPLKNKDNIIGICKMSSMGNPEIAPPPNLNTIYNVGFSDVIIDNENGNILRRVLLFAKSKDNKCITKYSFAAQLAISYLQKQGIEATYPGGNFKLGRTLFSKLKSDSGSYENMDARGLQILLNYRNSTRLAEEVTLTQVLNGKVNPDLVKDRLVIIGTTDVSSDRSYYTPYSASPQQPPRMHAVLIHAQVASQLISTTLDKRPLIWYMSEWAEVFWIWGWSVVGGVLAWQLRHPLTLALGGTSIVGGLVGICAALFLQAGWVPVIPPALALVITGVSVMTYTTHKTQQQTKIIIQQVEKQQEAIEQLNTLLKESTAIQDKHHHITPKNDPEKTTGDFLLGGRYEIKRVLGSGGFGRTYLAEDTQRPGNPICVVKQLMPARKDPKFMQVARRLFDSEAEILEVLGKHSQIPELLAYFEDKNEFYLVQEYIQGHTLNEELPPVRGVQNESFIIDMLKGVLEVLAYVHEHRVIHRDIKPNNIIRSATDNRLVLIDFGAVKLMQPPSCEETELATVAIGTRGYAPPEQFAGHPRLSSDIYALGMIAIQAATGIPPQELQPNSETGTVVWRRWTQVSVELTDILDKMVRYHFSDRYQSAADVLQDLKRISQ